MCAFSYIHAIVCVHTHIHSDSHTCIHIVGLLFLFFVYARVGESIKCANKHTSKLCKSANVVWVTMCVCEWECAHSVHTLLLLPFFALDAPQQRHNGNGFALSTQLNSQLLSVFSMRMVLRTKLWEIYNATFARLVWSMTVVTDTDTDWR